MKGKWKTILLILLILPIVVFFPACSCDNSTSTPVVTDIPCTVHFFTMSGDTFNIPKQTINKGGVVRRPEDPIKKGYVFEGWYTSNKFEPETLWRFDIDTVQNNMTLYAKWSVRKYG